MSQQKQKKKRKKNNYFTKVHENAIIKYAITNDKGIRTELYITLIGPALDEMVDKIVYTYRFNNLPNIDYLKESKYGNKIIIKESEFIPIANKGAKNPKYENQICYGISIDIDKSLDPIDISLYLLEYFYNHYDEFLFNDNFFDILYGSSDFRECLEDDGCNIETIFNDIDKDVIEFNKVREKYLLY